MIKRWHRNGAVSGLKARLPFKAGLRKVMRRLRPYQPDEGNDDYYLENALMMAGKVRETGKPVRGAYLEIGTGWTPVMSLVFFIAGYDDIHLCDLDPYLDEEGVNRAKELVLGSIDDVSAATGISPDRVQQRIDAYNYQYHCPFDLNAFAADSIDLAASRAVLEHVPASDLPALHAGLARILKPGGLACHLIDNSDHHEHNDKSISRVNFLQYSPARYAMIEKLTANRQNRLRHSDHADLLKKSGLTALVENGEPDPATLRALSGVTLAPEFADKAPEDLATLISFFLLEKPGA